MNKLLILAIGAAAGYAFGKYPNEISKAVVKGGVAVGTRLREIQEEISDDIEDQLAESDAVKASTA